MAVSEGARRLSLVAGLVPLGLFALWSAIMLLGRGEDFHWGFLLAGFLAFLLPWGTVRVIAWIVQGFRQG